MVNVHGAHEENGADLAIVILGYVALIKFSHNG